MVEFDVAVKVFKVEAERLKLSFEIGPYVLQMRITLYIVLPL